MPEVPITLSPHDALRMLEAYEDDSDVGGYYFDSAGKGAVERTLVFEAPNDFKIVLRDDGTWTSACIASTQLVKE